MNFIIDLSTSEEYNAILAFINRYIKERYYISYTIDKKSISAENIAYILLKEVFRLHNLPASIISDRDSQFIATIYSSFYKRLKI